MKTDVALDKHFENKNMSNTQTNRPGSCYIWYDLI